MAKDVVVPPGAEDAFTGASGPHTPPGLDDVFGPAYTPPPPAAPKKSLLRGLADVLPASEAPAPRPPGQRRGGTRIEADATASQGLLEPGNIDLGNRPRVRNADGSTSTVLSFSTNIDGHEVLLPRISDDGRVLSEDEAVDQYQRTGKHLGVFGSVGAATEYAERLHRDQERNLPAGLSDGVPQEPRSRRGGLRSEGVPPFVAPDDAEAAKAARYQPASKLNVLERGRVGPTTEAEEVASQQALEGAIGTLRPERQAALLSNGPFLSPSPPQERVPDSLSERAGAAVERAGLPGLAPAARTATDVALLGPEAFTATVRMGADLANLATVGALDPVVGWLKATDQVIKEGKSLRYRDQQQQLQQLMQDPEAGVMDVAGFVASHPGFAAELGIPSVPSVLAGMAGARIAQTGVRGLAAREAAAVRGATAANVGLNASNTFSDTQGDVGARLGAASIAGLGTLAAGGLGGAEATLATSTRRALPAAVAGTAAHEGAQEAVESLSQSLGQGVAEGNYDPGQAAKQAVIEGAIGAGIGGAAGAVSAAGGEAPAPAPTLGDHYRLAAAKGFLVKPPVATDTPDAQRSATDRVLQGVGAMYGIPKRAVQSILQAADGKPLDQLGAFYARAVQGLQRRGLVGKPVDAEVLDALAGGAVPSPEAAGDAGQQAEQEQPKPAGLPAAPPSAAAETGLSEPDPEAQAETLAQLDVAAHEAATSPLNDLPEPTDAQKAAGNYKVGHVRLDGFDVSIENPKGSVRRSKADAAQPWEVEMPAHYGYIRGTEGADGDHVDLTIGPAGGNGRYWVINQTHPDSADFDEHKVFTGVNSAEEALALYKRSFTGDFADKVFQSVSGELTRDEMREALPQLEQPQPFLGGQVQEQAEAAGDAGATASAEPAATAPAPRQTAPGRQLDPVRDTMLQALAKLGGVRRDEMSREFGLRPEELASSVAVGRLKGYPFRKTGGMSVDQAVEALTEAGYFDGVAKDDARSVFEDAARSELGGTPRLTSAGQEERGRVHAAEEVAAAAQAEHESQVEAAAERDAIMAETGLSQEEVATVTVGDLEVAASNVGEAEFMKALGFSEQEIADVTAAGKEKAGAEEAGRAAAGEASPLGGTGTAAARDQPQRPIAGRAPAVAEAGPTGPLSETFSGQHGQGMTEWNARPAQRRLSKERPELDWRVAPDPDESHPPDRYVVQGFERGDAPKRRVVRNAGERPSAPGNPASWVFVEKATGKAVLETSDEAKVKALNTEKYEAIPILQYLEGLNKQKPAPAAPESAATPAGERDEEGQRREEGRRQEVLTPAAGDATSAPAAPPTQEDVERETIALRKRLAVLKALEKCLS